MFVHNNLSVDQNQWKDSIEDGARRTGGEEGPSTPRLKSAQNIASVATTNVFIVRSALKYVTRPRTRDAETRATQTAFLPPNLLTAAASVTRTAPMEAQFHYTVYKFQGICTRHVDDV